MGGLYKFSVSALSELLSSGGDPIVALTNCVVHGPHSGRQPGIGGTDVIREISPECHSDLPEPLRGVESQLGIKDDASWCQLEGSDADLETLFIRDACGSLERDKIWLVLDVLNHKFTHSVFRCAQRRRNSNVGRDREARFLPVEEQHRLGSIDRGTASDRNNHVRLGFPEHFHTLHDARDGSVFTDLPERTGVGVLLLEHILDFPHDLRLVSRL